MNIEYSRHAIKVLAESTPYEKCLIYSKEHDAYWRENQKGYTNSTAEAGEYDICEAYEIISNCGAEKGLGIVILEPTQHDTNFKDSIICPHCGHEQQDTWEWELNDDDLNKERCQKCDKEFYVEVHVIVNYTTTKSCSKPS